MVDLVTLACQPRLARVVFAPAAEREVPLPSCPLQEVVAALVHQGEVDKIHIRRVAGPSQVRQPPPGVVSCE